VTIDHLFAHAAGLCHHVARAHRDAVGAGRVTRTIRLGTMVLVLPLRNPVYFAKEWATLDLLSGGRSILGIGVGWHEEEFELNGRALQGARAAYERGDRGGARAVGGRRLSPTRASLSVREALTVDPKPSRSRTRRSGSAGGTQPSEKVYRPDGAEHRPVLRRIAKGTPTPGCRHSSATPEMVKGDWDKVQRFAREAGRDPTRIGRVYSNFVWVLGKGEKPESRRSPHFSVYSGMDLDYWKAYYLLGTADEVAERNQRAYRRPRPRRGLDRPQPASNWGLEQLELIAGEVLPE